MFVARILPPPSLDSLSVGNGLACATTKVDVAGRKFTGASAVKFGGADAPSFTVVDDTHLQAVAPPHAPGTVDLTVTTSAGDGTASFTYLPAPTPVIAGVTPDRGSTDGGTAVTIAGSGFDCVRDVTFDGAPATNVQVTNGTVRAVTPAHARGPVNVVLSADNGGTPILSAPATFTYTVVPKVTAVLPDCGAAAGKTQMLINGADLTGASTVNFAGPNGSSSAPVFANPANPDNQIVAESPALADGDYDVSVTGPDATSAVVPGLVFHVPCAPGPPTNQPPDNNDPGTVTPQNPGGGGGLAAPPTGTGGTPGPGLSTTPVLDPTPGFVVSPSSGQAAAPTLAPTPVIAVPAPSTGGLSTQSSPVPPPSPPPGAAPTGVPTATPSAIPAATPSPGAQPGLGTRQQEEGPGPAPQYNMVGQHNIGLTIAYQMAGTLILFVGCAIVAHTRGQTPLRAKSRRPARRIAF
jgi:hypothetical protein